LAIKPSVLYASQVDTSDPAWPWGRAQNESALGARNGTPFEQTWVSDLWGWQQALLKATADVPSGIPDEPSGVPDRSGNGGTDSQYLRATRALNFSLLLPIPAATYAGSHFTFSPTNGWEQTTTGAVFGGAYLYFPLGPFPNSWEIRPTYLNTLTLRVDPATHPSALPTSKPGFRIWKQTVSGLVVVNDQLFTDPSSTIGEYNGAHNIEGIPSTPLEVSPDSALYIGIQGEYGTNALPGLRVISLRCFLSDRP
jgi:hypothetical protein